MLLLLSVMLAVILILFSLSLLAAEGDYSINPENSVETLFKENDLITINSEILVNDVIIKDAASPFWYETESGNVVMVPLKAIAELIGLDIFNYTQQRIRLGVAAHVQIGYTEVSIGRMAPVELPAAPVRLNGTVFVPIDFFLIIGQTVSLMLD